jgi:hypothetical protein
VEQVIRPRRKRRFHNFARRRRRQFVPVTHPPYRPHPPWHCTRQICKALFLIKPLTATTTLVAKGFHVFWLIFKGRYNPRVVGNSPGLRSTLLSSCLSCERENSVGLPLVHGKNANFCSCEEDHDVRQLTIHMAVELLTNNTVSHFVVKKIGSCSSHEYSSDRSYRILWGKNMVCKGENELASGTDISKVRSCARLLSSYESTLPRKKKEWVFTACCFRHVECTGHHVDGERANYGEMPIFFSAPNLFYPLVVRCHF